MSRRPSAITLTSDDSTILCADKFGDVYALPLLPSPDDELPEAPAPAATQPEEKDFTPSATVLTVHSGRNRRTLEEQLKMKAKGPLKTKETMPFKNDLLLGHVSMLTDLAFAKVDNRSYIITADRDEHIRVSRGLPQAHIIEGFCFGHEEFVSRLCLTQSGLLVSGGGDAQLFVWDWQNYQLVERLSLRDTVIQHIKSRPEISSSFGDDASFKIAVSGIWDVPSSNKEVNVSKGRFCFNH
jgi:tRNA (guanine-N(7)-)-methyltransferase subunit TRM82